MLFLLDKFINVTENTRLCMDKWIYNSTFSYQLAASQIIPILIIKLLQMSMYDLPHYHNLWNDVHPSLWYVSYKYFLNDRFL